jgi:RimJ/RimL family protein N-acetyltransferase
MNEADVYQNKIMTVFKGLKSIDNYSDLVAKSISLDGKIGYLTCVSELNATDFKLIELLAQWRMGADTFHNKFHVTTERTERWLRKLLLDIPDRILFLVLNRYGRPIGHMGFANALNNNRQMEFDNVIRGVSNCDFGLMSEATKSLLRWASSTFQPEVFYIRTLDDNYHAINFYKKLGFSEFSRQPLRRIEVDGEVNHIPLSALDKASPDRFFVCMELKGDAIARV